MEIRFVCHVMGQIMHRLKIWLLALRITAITQKFALYIKHVYGHPIMDSRMTNNQ